MARTRASAKGAGTSFETRQAAWLATVLNDDRIERRTRNGAKDRGDIAGVRHMGGRVVIECKEYGGRILAAEWTGEAETERGNDDALAGIVMAKRRGTTRPAEQWVLMTAGELVSLMTGNRDHLEGR